MLRFRDLAVTGSLLLFAGALTSAQVKVVRKNPGDVVTQKQRQKPKPKPPAEATVVATDEGYVDWSYLRQNNPGLVTAMVERVRKGESDYSTLGGLGTMGKLKEYASGAAKPAPSASPKSSTTGAATVLRRPGLAGYATKAEATSVGSFSKLFLPLDASPTAVNFGSLVDGQKVRKVVYVKNVPAGTFKAALNTKSPFRIVQVKVLTGRYEFIQAGMWKDSLIRTYSEEAAGLTPASSVASKLEKGAFTTYSQTKANSAIGALSKSGLTGKETVTAVAVKNAPGAAALLKTVKREATEAPFDVEAPDGATVRVTLEFKPKFNLFSGDYVGNHNAVLNTTDGLSYSDVTLAARFEGVNLGVITIPQDREVTLLAAWKQEKHPSGGNMVTAQQKLRFSYGLTFLNPKAETNISISAVDLPPGVRLINSTGPKIPNGTTQGGVDFEMDFWGDDRGGQYGLGQEILIGIGGPTGVRYVSLTLNVLPSMRKYSCRGSLDNVYYAIDLMAYSDGSINAEWDYHTSNAWPTDGEFKFSIDGVQFIHYTSIWMTDDNRMKAKGSPRFHSPDLAEQWTRFVQKNGSFWIKVTEKFRL